MKLFKLYIPVVLFMLGSCYMYHTQEPALVKNVDVDETLKVAADEMKKMGTAGQSLGIWVLKDQVVTPKQAGIIADMYLDNLDKINTPFNIWHAAWTITNLYRLGNADVKAKLEKAYQVAIKQPERISDDDDFKGAAIDHIRGKQITTGFIHIGGLNYAYDHLVVPGNKKYIQSYEEYLKREE